MLKSLSVTNFALIEAASIEFNRGLNILTGETGAGKSIVIDAFSAILGGRSSPEYIRTGCDYYRVQGVFDVSDSPVIKTLLESFDISLEDDDNLIISRRLAQSGKNSIMINGCHVSLGTLKKIGSVLVDIHGQHENQTLLNPESYLHLVDGYDGNINKQLAIYRNLFKQFEDITDKLEKSKRNSRDRIQRMDLLTWQTQEIAASKLKIGEDDEIQQELSILANAEKIATSLQQVYLLLNEERENIASVLSQLNTVRNELEVVNRYDPKFKPQLNEVTNTIYCLQEVSNDVRNYVESFDYDPKRLVELQGRLDTIYKLKRKYGSSIHEILDYYKQSVAEIEELVTYDERIEQLTVNYNELSNAVKSEAELLSKMRVQAAKQMSESIIKHLQDLGMPHACFEIMVENTNKFTPLGADRIIFQFSANMGEEIRPLQKVASGGELSRIALAIKTVSSQHDSALTMVFDEIDAGIGGKTAQIIAEKIALVACQKQVLCITHLPQIACMADNHIFIEKQNENNRTSTEIRILDLDGRITEITRMISGDNITKIGLDNTRQMIENARKKKEEWKN